MHTWHVSFKNLLRDCQKRVLSIPSGRFCKNPISSRSCCMNDKYLYWFHMWNKFLVSIKALPFLMFISAFLTEDAATYLQLWLGHSHLMFINVIRKLNFVLIQVALICLRVSRLQCGNMWYKKILWIRFDRYVCLKMC